MIMCMNFNKLNKYMFIYEKKIKVRDQSNTSKYFCQ